MPSRPPSYHPAATPTDLTPRQREVVRLIAGGLSWKEVATQLGIEQQTVRGHMHTIYSRTGLPGAIALARWWWEYEERDHWRQQVRADVRAELRQDVAPLWREAAIRLRDLRYVVHDDVPYVRRKAAIAVVIGVLAEALDREPEAINRA